MNRYVAAGLVQDLAKGKKIVVVCPVGAVTYTMREVLTYVPKQDLTTVRRTNGDEEIRHHSGGVLFFKAVGQRPRGMSAHVLFTDETLTPEQELDYMPLVVPNGEWIRR